MTKTISTFGLALGAVLCVYMVYGVNLMYNTPDFKGNMFLGYLTQVMLFSLVFFGVWYFRNKQNQGIIKFLKALKIGTLIALVASIIYVIAWLFCYYLFVPDFIDVYMAHVLSSVPADELATKTKEMENFKEMYKSPFFISFITLMEIFPTGLVVAILSAVILRKKAESTS